MIEKIFDKMRNGVTGISKFIIYGFGLLIFSFLSIAAWVCDGNVTDKYVGIKGLAIAAGVMLAAVFIMKVLAGASSRFPESVNRILCVFLLCIVAAGCFWWIVNAASLPNGDSQSVYDIAVRAMHHDLLPIAPTGSYMSLCPYQSGLVLYFEAVLRLIPGSNHMTIQYLNLFFVALSLVSGYFLVKHWFSSHNTTAFWCFLMFFCLPYYFYVNFMYGEIPSIGLMMFAAWMITELLRKRKLWQGILAVCAMAGGVAVRKNTWIFLIACALVLGVLAFREKNGRLLLFVAAFLALSWLGGSYMPRAFYELRAGNTMGEGIPSISSIAMGLQDGGGTHAGTWNGYHSDLFMEYNYQGEIPKKLSRQSIHDSLSRMAANPAYAVDFFYRKQVMQWCYESYDCMSATRGLFENRTEAAWKCYQGEWYDGLCAVMGWHQNLVYVGVFLFCLRSAVRWCRRKKEPENASRMDLWKLVLLVTVIGGFLFSLFWEGGSRYTMPYLVMLIPYAASGYDFSLGRESLRRRSGPCMKWAERRFGWTEKQI